MEIYNYTLTEKEALDIIRKQFQEEAFMRESDKLHCGDNPWFLIKGQWHCIIKEDDAIYFDGKLIK